MNELLEKLHDIEGLDSISGWPLAPGWWVLIGCGIFVLGLLVGFAIYRILFKRSWRSDTFQKLDYLEATLSEATSRETLVALSEYLRRIVLRRFPRKECAALMGTSWLQWLTKNDPKKFDWENKGLLLMDAPYAPLHTTLPTHQIKDLIHAVRNWVR